MTSLRMTLNPRLYQRLVMAHLVSSLRVFPAVYSAMALRYDVLCHIRINRYHFYWFFSRNGLLSICPIANKCHIEAPSRHQMPGLKQPVKRSRPSAPGSSPTHTIVHRVLCRGGHNHSRHEKEAHFFDTPRLFAKDDKTSALRGRRPFRNLDMHLDSNPDVSFIVYRNYSCDDYLQSYENNFQRLPVPDINYAVLASILPYFSTLSQDGEDAVVGSESITIVSSELREATNAMASLYPDAMGAWGDVSELHAPYLAVYHCRDIIAEYVASVDNGTSGNSKVQLGMLFNYIRSKSSQDWIDADLLFQKGLVSAAHLAKLYAPDEVVVNMANDYPMAYGCHTVNTLADSLDLTCWSWSFDGHFFKEKHRFSVSWSSRQAEVPIASLEVFPLKYDGRIKTRLLVRGQQFWQCRARKFVAYKPNKYGFEAKSTNSRYMIDTSTFNELHPSQSLQQDELGSEAMERDKPPDETFLLLLPYSIHGFGLDDKKWRTLTIEDIREIKWNEDAFDKRLVLSSNKKELIKALITVQIGNSNNRSSDIIEGKGNGLIILLHGGPGTGKTLTAETIAEHVKKPLYRVTCGDIGTDPEGVEKYLESVLCTYRPCCSKTQAHLYLDIGTIWGCVVLLDEADVFLEERTQTDLQRNALVSVFLRVLEYYEGILILTSNRVGMFDEAFMSRVQLAMHYPTLNDRGRFQIWDNFLKTLKVGTENVNHDELKDKLNVLAQHPLNGRQIRNIVNTARQLAHYKDQRLAYSHFEQAIEVAKEFEEYVEKTHGGHTNEEWMRSQRARF